MQITHFCMIFLYCRIFHNKLTTESFQEIEPETHESPVESEARRLHWSEFTEQECSAEENNLESFNEKSQDFGN